VFIAVEALRQEDSPNVSATMDGRQLPLDATVWTAGSPTFNPPNLTGQVSERTALDAMIAHSDDTATDIVLTQVGADNVRQLLASAGLQHTLIADRTRSFFGYLKGAADYETFTWDQLMATANDPFVEAPLNTTITFASSADDLVSFYEQAMRGDFFEHDETLKVLRSLMSTGDVVWTVPLPLGASSFGKGGSFDVPGFHALSAPGAMFFDDVWVYFSFILNWNAPEAMDATTLAPFLSATAKALQLVKDALAGPLACDPPARLPATR
jgi:beta-lactamase class A